MHIIRVETLHNSLYDGIMHQTLCCKQDVLVQGMESVSIFCMRVCMYMQQKKKVFRKAFSRLALRARVHANGVRFSYQCIELD